MPSTTFENLNLQKKELITNALLTVFSQHSLASAQVARIENKQESPEEHFINILQI